MPRGPSGSVLRATYWSLGPSSAASGIFLTCSPQHCLVCFSWVQIPLPLVSTFFTLPCPVYLLPSASLLTLTQLPHALVSLSDTVYTISVATYYSFVGILLLLVLCCTIPSYPFCFSSFFPHSLFPFFCFPPSLPPLTHYSFPSFPPFNSTFPLILFSIPHLLIFSFPHLPFSFSFLIQLFPFHYHSFSPPFIPLSSR